MAPGLIDANGLSFGAGVYWLAGGLGQSGLVITSSTDAEMLLGTATNGLAIVADDMSMAIRDVTAPANNFSGNPNVKLTYASPSTKNILTVAGIYEAGTTLRCEFDASGNPLGFRIEEARTNVVLHNRDLTNAVWTKTNITAAKDQTGIDGVANSASSLTATAGNGTCLQAITLASSARYQSAFIKRITGSGVINMTMDNGTTWTAVTVTSSWTPLVIPTQTLANPTVGFRIVTSGDAIAVDFVQNENGTFRTSPIGTAGVPQTRVLDNISISTSLFPYNQPEGALVASFVPGVTTATAAIAQMDDGTNNERVRVTSFSGTQINNLTTVGGVSQASYVQSPVSAGTLAKTGMAWKLNDTNTALNGTVGATDVSCLVPTVTTLRLGIAISGGNPINGHIRSVLYIPRRLSNAELQAVTA